MNFQTSSGRSCSSLQIFQSSSIRQSSSTGPSRNACSSSVSAGAGSARSFCQFGRPLKSSPSHHTVPASSASRSVWDMGGSNFRNRPSSGLLRSIRRSGITFKIAAASMKINQTTMFPRPATAKYPRNAATTVVQTQSLTRKYANNQTSESNRTTAITPSFVMLEYDSLTLS